LVLPNSAPDEAGVEKEAYQEEAEIDVVEAKSIAESEVAPSPLEEPLAPKVPPKESDLTFRGTALGSVTRGGSATKAVPSSALQQYHTRKKYVIVI
jgi:hypothetical protein